MTMKAVHSFRCTAFFIQSLIFFLCRRYVYEKTIELDYSSGL